MREAVRLALTILLAGCQSMGGSDRSAAMAELRNAAGHTVGSARLDEVSGGVHVVLEMTGMPPGPHGVHIHAVGKCEAPGFASAGGHVNPGGRQHGSLNPQGPHAGDLPNITIDTDGTGRMETTAERAALDGGQTSLLDSDGSALMVHAGPDDLRTDPAGGSGPRIACGVITRAAHERGFSDPVRGY